MATLLAFGRPGRLIRYQRGSFYKKDLEAVDLLKAEEKVGPNGETLRKMISDIYHCKTREE